MDAPVESAWPRHGTDRIVDLRRNACNAPRVKGTQGEWVPVDVTYGRLTSGDPSLKWFYLGGLDNFRIAFNDDFSREFVPQKTFFRSDNVDSQRGEVEWEGGNLYYDKWSYHFDWKILPSKQQAQDPAG